MFVLCFLKLALACSGNFCILNDLGVLACEQTLWGALAAGRKKERELAVVVYIPGI